MINDIIVKFLDWLFMERSYLTEGADERFEKLKIIYPVDDDVIRSINEACYGKGR